MENASTLSACKVGDVTNVVLFREQTTEHRFSRNSIRTCRFFMACCLAFLGAERIDDPFQHSIELPLPKVGIHRSSRRQIRRERPPIMTTTHDIQYPVHHLARLDLVLVSVGRDWRQQRSDALPVGVGQIGRIAFSLVRWDDQYRLLNRERRANDLPFFGEVFSRCYCMLHCFWLVLEVHQVFPSLLVACAAIIASFTQGLLTVTLPCFVCKAKVSEL